MIADALYPVYLVFAVLLSVVDMLLAIVAVPLWLCYLMLVGIPFFFVPSRPSTVPSIPSAAKSSPSCWATSLARMHHSSSERERTSIVRCWVTSLARMNHHRIDRTRYRLSGCGPIQCWWSGHGIWISSPNDKTQRTTF